MAYRIFWTPIAVQDLRDICDFISGDNPVAAQRMGEEFIKQSEAMAALPTEGVWCLGKKDPLIRETLVGSYRSIYRVDESTKVLALARIWHSTCAEHQSSRERRFTTGLRCRALI